MRRRVQIAAGMLAILLALGIASSAPASAGQAPVPAVTGPKAKLLNPVYDFGTVFEGQKVTHTFVIKNLGSKDLIITGMKTSCGCTAAAPSSNRVGPGATTDITVTFDTHFQKGHRERTITAYTNDPSAPTMLMTLQGDVEVEVEATPSEVAFGQVHHGIEESREVTISELAKDSKGFSVGPVTNTSPYIKVTQAVRKDGKPGAVLTVTLLKTMPIGTFDDSINVVTNRKPIEVHVFGQVTGDLVLDPAQVSFGIVPSRQGVVRILRLTNQSARPVKVLGVSSTNNSVVAKVDPVTPGKEYKITVELRRNTPDGQLRGSLAIRTDDAQQSTLTVPFYGIIGSFEG